MSPKYRITLDQLRKGKTRFRYAVRRSCAEDIEKVMNAMDTANYNIQPLYKYVVSAEQKIKEEKELTRRGNASTQYYLSQYLDRQKFPKK